MSHGELNASNRIASGNQQRLKHTVRKTIPLKGQYMNPIQLSPAHTLLAAAISCALLTTHAHAQPADTRIGTLTFENGFPSDATATRLYDEMDFQRACQAYLWALPAVGFHALQLAQRDTLGVKDGDIGL